MSLLKPSYVTPTPTPTGTTPFNQETVASPWSAEAAAYVTNDGQWWLKAIDDPTLNIGGLRVRGPLAGRVEQSIGVFRPLGRDTPIVVSGDVYGQDGTYAVLFTTESEWVAAQALLFDYTGDVCVQDPFGGQKIIRITSRDLDHDGTAGNPRRTVTIGYVEVD